jgi:hypothetical protein
MAVNKKAAVKRQAWNKGVEVGNKRGFTPAQMTRIRKLRTMRISGLALECLLLVRSRRLRAAGTEAI